MDCPAFCAISQPPAPAPDTRTMLPKLGETMTEASVEKWRKSEGEPIKKGDVILEITTDKATLEVESSIAGVLMASVGAMACFVVSAASYIPFIGVALWILPRWTSKDG